MTTMNTPDQLLCRWFESDGLYMAVEQMSEQSIAELQLDPASLESVQDLLDAIVLADHEPLLQCVGDWLAHDFNWKPVRLSPASSIEQDGSEAEESSNSDSNAAATPDTVAAATMETSLAPLPLHLQTQVPRLTFSLTSKEGQKRTLYLAVSYEELTKLPALPEHWQTLVSMTPHLLRCEIGLQNTSLDVDEWEKLRPGAMVLLPESFAKDWPVTLHPAADEPDDEFFSQVKAGLFVEQNCLQLLPQAIQEAQPAQDDEYHISIRLQSPVLVNRLYIHSAWQAGQNVLAALGEPVQGAKACVLRFRKHEAEVQALHGQIVQLGLGLGFLLDDTTTTQTENPD